jgi:hypothetical protein
MSLPHRRAITKKEQADIGKPKACAVWFLSIR